MLGSVFGKTVWEQRWMIVAWAVGLTAVGVMYAVFYPLVRTPEYTAAMATFPPEMLQALGMDDLSSPAGYLGATTFGILGPVLIVIFGATLGGRAVAGEEEAGRLDVLLAHPLARWRAPVERFGALLAALLLACLVLWLALVAVAGAADLTAIGAGNLAAAALHLALLGATFGALALAVGAATGSRALALGVVALVGVVTYVLNTLGPSIEGLAWARDLSPFHYYSGGQPLVNGLQVRDALVLLAVSIGLVALGALAFDRRDIAV